MIVFGAISFTVISTVVVPLPPAFVAVTVYTVEGERTVGVPLISPVVVLNDKPVGSDGAIDQETTAPPLAVGVVLVIAESFVKVNELGL